MVPKQIYVLKRFRSYRKGTGFSVGQRAAKLHVIKVGGLNKKMPHQPLQPTASNQGQSPECYDHPLSFTDCNFEVGKVNAFPKTYS